MQGTACSFGKNGFRKEDLIYKRFLEKKSEYEEELWETEGEFYDKMYLF